mgnify:CR=1 FL=1
MAHIDTIGASIYTSLWINAGTLTNELFEGVPQRPGNTGAFRAYFETPNVSDVALPPTWIFVVEFHPSIHPSFPDRVSVAF